MKTISILITLLLCLPMAIWAQKDGVNKAIEKEFGEMKTYYMVFLKKGPNRPTDSLKIKELQAQHLGNITRLAELGKIAIAGPFLDKGEVRGIFIMDVANQAEAEELVKTDPAVAYGSLTYEIRPWMSQRGRKLP